MDYSKFTTHRDPTGNAHGHKENLIKLAQAGHQIRVMSADQYGVVYEAFDIADQYNTETIAVYRPTSEGQEGNSKKWNFGQSYPWNTVGHNYTMSPQEAAENHIWAYHEQLKIIPEWDTRTWFLFFNEIDHERLEYCSEVALIMAKYAVANGLKFAFFGMNSGEPDTSQWYAPHTAALLRYMAANPANVALALHEYSFDKDILNDFGYLVGRYFGLVGACEEMGIDFENIRLFITECGHGKDIALSPNSWVPTVDELATTYGDYANIQLVALWAISSISVWDGNALSAKVREAFDYSAQKATEHEPIIKEFNNGGYVPPETKHKAIVLKSPQPREFTAAQWQTLSDYGYTKAHTMTASHDDTMSLLQAGSDDSLVKIVYPELETQIETIQAVESAGYAWVDVTREVFSNGSKPPPVTPPPIEPPTGDSIDLWDYIGGGQGGMYIIKTVVDGHETNEKYLPQPYKDGHLIQKGENGGEFYKLVTLNGFVYISLAWDTTPNENEYYKRTVNQNSTVPAAYCPRYMAVGDSLSREQAHFVQYYHKATCQPSDSPYSGNTSQTAVLVAHHDTFTTKYGATFNNVAVLDTGHEKQYFAKGFGRIGWEMPVNGGDAWATPEDISNQTPPKLVLPSCL